MPAVRKPGGKVTSGIAGALLLTLAGYLFFDQLVLLGLTLWVTRFDHADIQIVAFDDRGRELNSTAFFQIWRPALIARDSNDSPRFGIQHGLGSIRVAVPKGEASSLEILWPVEGFGKVLLRADNAGRGYFPAPDGRTTIELIPELARSRVEELLRWVGEHNERHTASASAESKLLSARSLLREIKRVRNPRERARRAYQALRLALEASELEVLAESRESIESNRRQPMLIRLIHSSGRPFANRRVRIRQERFDFLFGAYHDGYNTETISHMRAAGLNYATLHLNWLRTASHDGFFDFGAIDREFAPGTLQEDGFTLRGHAMVWFPKAWMPFWMEPLRGQPSAMCVAVRRYVDAAVDHYKDRVQIWEASNEGHAAWARWGLDDDGMVEVVRTAAQEIRQLAPASLIMINLALPLGEDVSLKYYPLISQVSMGRIDYSATDPYVYAKRLLSAGVPYDLVGLQIYSGCWVGVSGGVQVPAIDLFRLATMLHRYSRLGKPIQITELAAPSSNRGKPGESYWHARADSATQADYLAGVFTIAYGNPNVDGINWWDLCDDRAFAESGGLFDSAWRPKPSYVRLKELLTGWRYKGDLMTDARGVVSFRGPSGEYRFSTAEGEPLSSVDVHLDGTSEMTVVTLEKNGSAKRDLALH